jgi:hypothetical protein
LKKSNVRPDYQVIRDGEWGRVFKPVRLLALPEGGLICLMHGFDDDTWIVFSLDVHGVVARSKIYRMKSVAEIMWNELCCELTEDAKGHLIEALLDPATKLTGPQRADAALELARLQIADDEEFQGVVAKADQFTSSHTPAECNAYIAKELAAYDERKKAAAAGGDDDESHN